MKKWVKYFVLAISIPHMCFATCELDKEQMYKQIKTFGSISTVGCPVNAYSLGVNRVENVFQSGRHCRAECFYAPGHSSSGVPCAWDNGSWGETLRCFFYR